MIPSFCVILSPYPPSSFRMRRFGGKTREAQGRRVMGCVFLGGRVGMALDLLRIKVGEGRHLDNGGGLQDN